MSATRPFSGTGRPATQKAVPRQGAKPANPARKFLMFSLGADEHELAQCLAKKRLHLVAAGARADNVPGQPEEQARFISGLRDRPMQCVRDWFYANSSFGELPDVQEACRILSDETEVGALGKAEQRLYWRSILAAFVQQQDSQAVSTFLQGVSIVQAPALPKLMKAQGISVKPSSAAQPAKGIDADAAASGKLAEAAPRRRPSAAVEPALSLSDVQIDDKSVLTVLGRRTKVLPSGQFFIHVSGILLGDSAVCLSPEESREVFPDTGDATGFPGTIHASASSAESLSLWRVEHRNPDKKAQYVVTDFLSHTYEVFDVPHPSSEPDLVRDWIREVYAPAQDVFPVFRLLDGPMLKLPAETTDPRTANFDAALSLYPSHPAVRWNGRTVVIKPFPATNLQYDCAPVRTAVKKLLREAAELSGLPSLTKRQIGDIADAADRHSTDATVRQSIPRARARLEQLFGNRDELQTLADDILLLPAVKDAVEEEKKRAAAAVREEAEASKAELGKLAAEKQQLQAEIESLRQSKKKEAAAVSREIRQAFDRAGTDGLKTLAGISVFKSILGLSADGLPAATVAALPVERANPVPAAAEHAAAPEHIRIADSEKLRQVLAGWRLHNGLSMRMLQALIAAAATQGVAILAGGRRHQAAAALASTLAAGTGCTVSVSGDMFSISDLMNAPAAVTDAGGTRAMPLGAFIAQQQSAGLVSVVRLRGANRVPPESLIPELLEVAGAPLPGAALTWTGKDGPLQILAPACPAVFLLELAHGRSVFPFTPPLAWEIPLIDTDAPWDDYHDPEFEVPAPCAAMAPDFFTALASAGAVPLPSARELPRNAVDAARKMKGACLAAGLDAADSALIPLVALAHCRTDGDALADMLGAAGGELAPAFAAYAAEAPFNEIFDMGED